VTERSRDSVVGIATGYGQDGQGVGIRVPVGEIIFSSPRLPDGLWGPPNLLSNGYQWLFPGGKAAGTQSWPLTSSLCRGQANMDLYIHSPIRLELKGGVRKILVSFTLVFLWMHWRKSRQELILDKRHPGQIPNHVYFDQNLVLSSH
jgi:hypothetical protein